MPDITKRASFYGDDHTAPHTFHIETDGAVVNITTGLYDNDGRAVTRVDVLPDDETRGGDGEGRIWRQTPGDARIIRQHPDEARSAAVGPAAPSAGFRIAVDADCPGCGYPERGFDPETGLFHCSSINPARCDYTSAVREEAPRYDGAAPYLAGRTD